MGILEQIIEMKRQGTPDEEIITVLRQHFSPKEIKDALDQFQIKEAVYNPVSEPETIPRPTPEAPAGGLYMPQTKEIPEGTHPEYYAEEYPQEFYQPESGYGYTAGEGFGTETVIEIAEQVFSEKIRKLQKRLAELNEFKTLSQERTENISERIKRIEATIDKLQAAILEKIGSYGKTLENIRKEMSMMQDSFGKMVPGLAERVEKEEKAERGEEKSPLKEKVKTKKFKEK